MANLKNSLSGYLSSFVTGSLSAKMVPISTPLIPPYLYNSMANIYALYSLFGIWL